MYANLILYFMSGTGNTLRVGKWMAEEAQRLGVAHVRLIPIQDAHALENIPDGASTLVGFLMPTHAFTVPWQMLSFLLRFPRRPGIHAFALATRAGTKFGRLHCPGFEGTANIVTALLLRLKGFRIRGWMGIDMPSNWTALHPGFTPAAVESIITRAKPRVNSFLHDIIEEQWRTNSLLVPLFGLALVPISAAYAFIGRFMLAKLNFANTRCNGCGVCAKNCPAHAISMHGKTSPRPYWGYACESCMRCMNFCPKHAVEAGHSWAVILYSVATIPVSLYVSSFLTQWLPIPAQWTIRWLAPVLQYIWFLVSMFTAYRIFSRLIRIPLINTIFTYTTFTKVYRRYHEPDTTLRDFAGDSRGER